MNDTAKRILDSIIKKNPQPDIGRLKAAIERKTLPDRVPFIELFPDDEIIWDVLGRKVPRLGKGPVNRLLRTAYDARIEFYRLLGYDYVRGIIDNFSLGHSVLKTDDTSGTLSRGKREWVNQGRGVITNRDEFNAYPWPYPDSLTVTALEYLSETVPESMGIIFQAGGVFEYTCWLMGFEVFAVSLYTQQDLVEDILQRVGSLCLAAVRKAASVPRVTAIFIGDDMGYKNQTMVHPGLLLNRFLPWHKKMAAAAHDKGKFYFLHSCGKIDPLMDYIINEAEVDAKHSFEDAVSSVRQVKQQYGDRIALIGGIDVDTLCRRQEAGIRKYVRDTVEICKKGGGYALGTGNTVANYIPTENYLAMLDEGLECCRY